MSLDALEVRSEMRQLERAVGPDAPPEVALCRVLGLDDDQGEDLRRIAEEEMWRVPRMLPAPAEEDGVLGALRDLLGTGFLQGARFALAVQRLGEHEEGAGPREVRRRFTRQLA